MVLPKEIKEYSQQNWTPISDDAKVPADMHAKACTVKTCTNEHTGIICSRDMDVV